MPLYNFSTTPTNIVDAQIASNADIDPIKMLFTGLGAWGRKSTPQSVADGTLTPINFSDPDIFDSVPSGIGQIHDPSTNPSRWIMRRAGLWLAQGILFYEGAVGTGSGRYAHIVKNGVTNMLVNQELVVVASQPVGVFVSAIVQTSLDTEYVEISAFHGQGSNVNVGDYGPGTFFGIAWLGNNT